LIENQGNCSFCISDGCQIPSIQSECYVLNVLNQTVEEKLGLTDEVVALLRAECADDDNGLQDVCLLYCCINMYIY